MNQDKKMYWMMKAVDLLACGVLVFIILVILLVAFVFIAGITMTIMWLIG